MIMLNGLWKSLRKNSFKKEHKLHKITQIELVGIRAIRV